MKRWGLPRASRGMTDMSDEEQAGIMPPEEMFSEGGFEPDFVPMSKPGMFLLRMGLFLALAVLVGVLIWQPLLAAFLGNIYINSLIAFVLVLAIAYCMLRVFSLMREVNWVNDFRRDDPGLPEPGRASLVAPMAAMLRDRHGPVSLPAVSARIILDSIASRLEESRDNTRYMGNLLIFLGILGTFWGLSMSVGSIKDVVAALNVGSANAEVAFEELQAGLDGPLGGLATAVSSSLFGIGGSLIVGFLGLQAAQAQNRFYNEFEDWISSVTTLGGGEAAAPMAAPIQFSGDVDSQAVGQIVQAMQENVRQVTALRQTMERNEGQRQQLEEWVLKTAENFSELDDIFKSQRDVLTGIAAVVQDVATAATERGKESLAIMQDLKETMATRMSAAPAPAQVVSTGEGGTVDLGPLDARLGQLVQVTQASDQRMAQMLKEIQGVTTRLASGAASTASAPAGDGTSVNLGALDDLNVKVGELLKLAHHIPTGRSDRDDSQAYLRSIDERLQQLVASGGGTGGSGAPQDGKSLEAIAHYTQELAQIARGSSEREMVEALRSINQLVHSMREGAEESRNELIQELRAEMKILTKTIAALIIESRRSEPRTRPSGGTA